MSANIPINVDKRVPFVDDVAVLGPDWTGATFLMHVRNIPGDIGVPVITDLTNAPAGSQGISVSYNPAYIYDEAKPASPASLIRMQIDEATIEALTLNNPTSHPLVLYYDLHVTPVGELKRVALRGMFTIDPGVTI